MPLSFFKNKPGLGVRALLPDLREYLLTAFKAIFFFFLLKKEDFVFNCFSAALVFFAISNKEVFSHPRFSKSESPVIQKSDDSHWQYSRVFIPSLNRKQKLDYMSIFIKYSTFMPVLFPRKYLCDYPACHVVAQYMQYIQSLTDCMNCTPLFLDVQ